jgi:hypothetical protein
MVFGQVSPAGRLPRSAVNPLPNSRRCAAFPAEHSTNLDGSPQMRFIE